MYLNIAPCGDKIEHELSITVSDEVIGSYYCECKPLIDHENKLIIHNAQDEELNSGGHKLQKESIIQLAKDWQKMEDPKPSWVDFINEGMSKV